MHKTISCRSYCKLMILLNWQHNNADGHYECIPENRMRHIKYLRFDINDFARRRLNLPVEYSSVQSSVVFFAISSWGSSISGLVTRGSVKFHLNTRSWVVWDTCRKRRRIMIQKLDAKTSKGKQWLTAFDLHWTNLRVVRIIFKFHSAG